jgi:hypothetical protein
MRADLSGLAQSVSRTPSTRTDDSALTLRILNRLTR